MLAPGYTYRTPAAYLLQPAHPSRHKLAGLTPAQRQLVHDEHRRTWLSHRTGGIGSSDASAIFGVNPRSSLTEVYGAKVHGYAAADNDLMRLGREMEDIAAHRFAEATGLHLRRSGILANREQPWMRATPDRLTGDGGGLEIKTTTERDHRHEWDDAPSDHALIQAQWSMAVTGLEHWWVAVLFRDTGKFEYYRVERDDALIEVLVQRASQFWHGNVLQRCAPPLDGSLSTLEAVRHIHPHAEADKTRDGGEPAAVVHRRLARIERQKKLLEGQENQAKAELLALAGDAEVLLANGVKVATLKANGTFRSRQYQQERPDQAALYMVQVEKLDHRAALADDPEAIRYVPRVVRPTKTSWEFDLSGEAPEVVTRAQLVEEFPELSIAG